MQLLPALLAGPADEIVDRQDPQIPVVPAAHLAGAFLFPRIFHPDQLPSFVLHKFFPIGLQFGSVIYNVLLPTPVQAFTTLKLIKG